MKEIREKNPKETVKESVGPSPKKGAGQGLKARRSKKDANKRPLEDGNPINKTKNKYQTNQTKNGGGKG